MSQKSRFKMQGQGINAFRKTFPQLPGGTLKNPQFIQTAHGYGRFPPPFFFFLSLAHAYDRNRLLINGWWKYCRKPVRSCRHFFFFGSRMLQLTRGVLIFQRTTAQIGPCPLCGVWWLALRARFRIFTPCSSSLSSPIGVEGTLNGACDHLSSPPLSIV
jgi:hypothetical protein